MKPRLVIFTGKGGVGKTTVALAYALHLKNKGKKVLYNSFYQPAELELIKELNIPVFDMTVEQSAEVYIGNKLGSKTVASWIMSTTFFKSLFQMLPGLSHMILLGHIIKELELNPELTIILDSPASGHAMTMFEASSNFKRIFKSGIIVEDIEKMKANLEDPNFLKTIIVSLPNELAIAEANELKEELAVLYKNIDIVINNSLLKNLSNNHIDQNELPDFLIQKCKNESAIITQHKTLAHITENNFAKIVTQVEQHLGEVM